MPRSHGETQLPSLKDSECQGRILSLPPTHEKQLEQERQERRPKCLQRPCQGCAEW